jgi:methyltransferase (TIGR00027 family)
MGVIDDQYAQRMLPTHWRWWAAFLRLPGLGRLGQHPSFAYLAGRILFFDQCVAEALAGGIRQVVVVAAGFDSRAWRFMRQGVRFFEIDLPATQTDKRSRAPEGGPVYVPADVTDGSLVGQLTQAGFHPGQPTAFTVEGLTMYLTKDQVLRLLQTLADLGGPGSCLAVNFGVGFERADSRRGRIGRWVMAWGGEEFRLRLAPEDAPGFLSLAGWAIGKTITGPQFPDHYLGGTTLAAVKVTTSGFVVEASTR